MAGRVRTIRLLLQAEVSDARRQMERLAQSTDKVRYGGEKAGTALGRMVQSAQANSQAWDRAGKTLVGFGVATTAAMGYAIKAAVDWESAWTGVLKTVNGTDEQLAAVESGLRDLAKTLPTSHTEIAAVAEAAGQLGVATKDIVSFTKTMIDLGQTTNLTADEAATSIAQLMNVMQTAPDEVDNLGAALVALGNDGASTERDIIQMAQRIAGAGTVIGLSEGEVLGLANALASVGIDVEAGGTAISSVMIDIAKSVSTGSDDLTEWARVAGMSASDFTAAWKSNPAEALVQVIEGLGRLNAAGGDVFTTLQNLGQSDRRVSQALLGLAASSDGTRKSVELGNQAWRDNTALIAEAEKRYDTTEAKLQIAKNTIDDAAITIGQTFTPVLAGLAEAVADVATWFGNLPDPVQRSVGALGGVAGVASLAAGAFLLTFPRVIETVKAFRDLQNISPRVSTGLGRVGKAAGTAAAAFAVFQVAALIAGTAMDDLPGVATVTKSLIDLGNASEKVTPDAQAARDALEEMFTVSGSGGAAIDGVSDALEALNANGFLKTLDNIGSGFGAFDSTTGLARAAVNQFDAALTSLAQSGATQEVANALAYYQERATEAGVSTERAMSFLPQYQEYLASTEVQQKLAADSADGLAGSLGGEGGVAPMTEEAAEALKKWREAVSSADASFLDLGGLYDGLVQKNQEAAQAAADATKDTADSWEDFAKDFPVTADSYIAELQRQVDAQNAWEDNILAITARTRDGMSEDMRVAADQMIDELIDLGPEGAQQVQLLHDMSDEELQTVIELYKEKGAQAVGEFTQEVEAAKNPRITVDADISAASSKLAQLKDQLNRTLAETRNPLVGWGYGQTAGHAGQFASGGAVFGPGTETSDSIAVRLSNNEHVWSAAEVRAAGGHASVAALRNAALAGSLRGYANGGSPGWSGSAPAASLSFPDSVRLDAQSVREIAAAVLAGSRNVSVAVLEDADSRSMYAGGV